jgi:hypothetical protein
VHSQVWIKDALHLHRTQDSSAGGDHAAFIEKPDLRGQTAHGTSVALASGQLKIIPFKLEGR